jgi:hypothetical protein
MLKYRRTNISFYIAVMYKNYFDVASGKVSDTYEWYKNVVKYGASNVAGRYLKERTKNE